MEWEIIEEENREEGGEGKMTDMKESSDENIKQIDGSMIPKNWKSK